MSESMVSEQIGAVLGLVLDLDTATYAQLRTEFLAMTARAAQDSGLSRPVIAEKAAVGKTTVYNYAGDPSYTSFPKPEQLTKYLRACGFTDEQVVFAVARCELIRILYPEGESFTAPAPRPWPVPLVGPLVLLVGRYELLMQEMSEQVRLLLAGVVPARAAMRAISTADFPFLSRPEQFVRELFTRTGIPLATEVDFAPPRKLAPLDRVPVLPGDIIRTEHGHLGILTDSRRLIYLSTRGWPRSMQLGDRVAVAAWRLTSVQRDYHLDTDVARVAARGGRQHKDESTAPAVPRLTAVVALVCEKLEIAHQRGVALPVSARDVFDAAVGHGVEFDYTVRAWAPATRSRPPTRTTTAARTRTPAPATTRRPSPAAPRPATSPTPSAPAVPAQGREYAITAAPVLAEHGHAGDVEVVAWHAAPGQQVRRGQPLVRIENPLAGLEIDVPAPATGTLTRLAVDAGRIVDANHPFGIVTAPPRRH